MLCVQLSGEVDRSVFHPCVTLEVRELHAGLDPLSVQQTPPVSTESVQDDGRGRVFDGPKLAHRLMSMCNVLISLRIQANKKNNNKLLYRIGFTFAGWKPLLSLLF